MILQVSDSFYLEMMTLSLTLILSLGLVLKIVLMKYKLTDGTVYSFTDTSKKIGDLIFILKGIDKYSKINSRV
jgi:hypothetical protein